MHSSAATIHRLLGALEDLGRSEEVALACGDGVTFLALQHRAEPLVARIVSLVSDRTQPVVLDEALRTRGQALVREQQERGTRMRSVMNHLRDELVRIGQSRLRARNLHPAYGRRLGAPSGFVAQG